ncbi:hypothetical protein STEG23_036156 [Scotinomys teguina]
MGRGAGDHPVTDAQGAGTIRSSPYIAYAMVKGQLSGAGSLYCVDSKKASSVSVRVNGTNGAANEARFKCSVIKFPHKGDEIENVKAPSTVPTVPEAVSASLYPFNLMSSSPDFYMEFVCIGHLNLMRKQSESHLAADRSQREPLSEGERDEGTQDNRESANDRQTDTDTRML